jgi:hypothetical protein
MTSSSIRRRPVWYRHFTDHPLHTHYSRPVPLIPVLPIPVLVWDLWWTKRRWYGFFFAYFDSTLQMSLHQCCLLVYLSTALHSLRNKRSSYVRYNGKLGLVTRAASWRVSCGLAALHICCFNIVVLSKNENLLYDIQITVRRRCLDVIYPGVSGK